MVCVSGACGRGNGRVGRFRGLSAAVVVGLATVCGLAPGKQASAFLLPSGLPRVAASWPRLVAFAAGGDKGEPPLGSDGEEEDGGGFLTESDRIRLTRARLTEEYNRSVRRRKRVFVPYIDACLWARRQGFESKEEWDEWVDLGEKRTPYITAYPERYYTETGDWISWDHFLGLDPDAPLGVNATETGNTRGEAVDDAEG